MDLLRIFTSTFLHVCVHTHRCTYIHQQTCMCLHAHTTYMLITWSMSCLRNTPSSFLSLCTFCCPGLEYPFSPFLNAKLLFTVKNLLKCSFPLPGSFLWSSKVEALLSEHTWQTYLLSLPQLMHKWVFGLCLLLYCQIVRKHGIQALCHLPPLLLSLTPVQFNLESLSLSPHDPAMALLLLLSAMEPLSGLIPESGLIL